MGRKGDLSDFERGMVAAMSISETADLLGFSRKSICMVYREWSGKKIIQFPGRKYALLMPEVRGEWPGWLKMMESQQ